MYILAQGKFLVYDHNLCALNRLAGIECVYIRGFATAIPNGQCNSLAEDQSNRYPSISCNFAESITSSSSSSTSCVGPAPR
jgi:hypothetical protein